MAKNDYYYPHVKEALIKANYKITHDPYILNYKGTQLQADLGAEKIIAAAKDEHVVVVEIKSFLTQSKIYEWHRA